MSVGQRVLLTREFDYLANLTCQPTWPVSQLGLSANLTCQPTWPVSQLGPSANLARQPTWPVSQLSNFYVLSANLAPAKSAFGQFAFSQRPQHPIFNEAVQIRPPVTGFSPMFYEQLLHQNPFAKKLQTQIVST
jgi:hypothetical protein